MPFNCICRGYREYNGLVIQRRCVGKATIIVKSLSQFDKLLLFHSTPGSIALATWKKKMKYTNSKINQFFESVNYSIINYLLHSL